MTDVKKKEVKKKATKTKTSEVKKSTISSPNTVIFSLVFFLCFGLIGGLYLLWNNQTTSSNKQRLILQSVDQQLADFKKQQNIFTQQNEIQIKNILTFQENLRHNLTNLIRNKQHLRNDWLMAEAEYLIKIANHRLLLAKDVTTAIVALKSADARLAEVADPALLRIRKILNKDLQSLNNVNMADLSGISVTLSALSANIANLPLRTPDPKTHKITQEEKLSASQEVTGISDLPAAIWKDIKSLIIIRNHEKPLEPLLAPNQYFFLIQNLALMLEQSRLAVLNGNNEIFQERLIATKKWINHYFDNQHNVTRNMLASIDELQKVDINPALPDISSTYSAIKKYRIAGELLEKNKVKGKNK